MRAQALDAVAATHRQYRRDLVPVRQAPVPSGPDGDEDSEDEETTTDAHEETKKTATMPIDPERWTNNTKAAFSAATGHAASSNHPELTPAHLLDALLQQQETMTRPLLSQVGVDPDVLAGKMHEQLLRLPAGRGRRRAGAVA